MHTTDQSAVMRISSFSRCFHTLSRLKVSSSWFPDFLNFPSIGHFKCWLLVTLHHGVRVSLSGGRWYTTAVMLLLIVQRSYLMIADWAWNATDTTRLPWAGTCEQPQGDAIFLAVRNFTKFQRIYFSIGDCWIWCQLIVLSDPRLNS